MRSRLRGLRQLAGWREALALPYVALVAALLPLSLRLPLWRADRMLRFGPSGPPLRLAGPELARVLETAQRALHPLVRSGCITRAMTLWWLLGGDRAALRLCFGIGGAADDHAGHCWVEQDGAPYLEPVDLRERFPEHVALPLR